MGATTPPSLCTDKSHGRMSGQMLFSDSEPEGEQACGIATKQPAKRTLAGSHPDAIIGNRTGSEP